MIKVEWNESSSEDIGLYPQTIQGTQTTNLCLVSNLIAKVKWDTSTFLILFHRNSAHFQFKSLSHPFLFGENLTHLSEH